MNMDRSYVYTKKFIDEEVKKLNQPLRFTEDLKRILSEEQELSDDAEGITEIQLQNIINKVNLKIKRHNKTLFSAQRKNQIIQQIIKAEQYKILIVNNKLVKIKIILRPILVPDIDGLSNGKNMIREFGELVKELPEGKYLFPKEDIEIEEHEVPSSNSEDESESGLIVEDTEERIIKAPSKRRIKSQFKKDLLLKVNNSIDRISNSQDDLLTRYENLRQKLIHLNDDLIYRMEKLDFLNNLKGNLANSFNLSVSNQKLNPNGLYDSDEDVDGDIREDVNSQQISKIQSNLISSSSIPTNEDGLLVEINKFRVLVEKISYKLEQSTRKIDLKDALSEINKNSI